MSNFQLEIAGDEAAGRAMFLTAFRLPGLDEVLFTGGYYDLRLLRTTAAWRLQRLAEDNRWTSKSPFGTAQG